VRRDEQEEGEGDPEPADFDEVDVEGVALFREVAWCFFHIVGLLVR